LERALRDLEQRPEELGSVSDDPTAFAPLAEEKRRLVAAIGAPDADRKGLGLRIGALNRAMTPLLVGERRRLEEEIARLVALADEHAAATYRAYPYFLYDPADLLSLFP
ncbi:MAG: hypothetical protein HQK87_05180, partial [Nitrospinae bacterium]|nr:hypothetical protein [Nitrospinota bacterium]